MSYSLNIYKHFLNWVCAFRRPSAELIWTAFLTQCPGLRCLNHDTQLWRICLKTSELIRLVFDSSNDKIGKHGSQNCCQEFLFLFPETFKLWSVFLWGKIKRPTLFETPQSFCSATMSYTVYGGYLGQPIRVLSLEELHYHNTVTPVLLFSFSFFSTLKSCRLFCCSSCRPAQVVEISVRNTDARTWHRSVTSPYNVHDDMKAEQEIMTADPYGHNLPNVRVDEVNYRLLKRWLSQKPVVAQYFCAVWRVTKAYMYSHSIKSSILHGRGGNRTCLRFSSYIDISLGIHLTYLWISYTLKSAILHRTQQ